MAHRVGLVVVLFFLIFPVRTRIALDRLERHPGLCSAVGLLGWVAVLPLALLLLCTIVLIPFIVLEGGGDRRRAVSWESSAGVCWWAVGCAN